MPNVKSDWTWQLTIFAARMRRRPSLAPNTLLSKRSHVAALLSSFNLGLCALLGSRFVLAWNHAFNFRYPWRPTPDNGPTAYDGNGAPPT